MHDMAGVGVDTDLFRPVNTEERTQLLESWSVPCPFEGKSVSRKKDFARRWQEGDWEVLENGRDAYNQSSPDEDTGEILGSLQKDAPLALFVGALTSGKGIQSLLTAFAGLESAPSGDMNPAPHLLIVGSGNYREVLEAFTLSASEGDWESLSKLIEKGHDLDRNGLCGPWLDVRSYLDEKRLSEWLRTAKGLSDRVHFLGRLSHDLLHRVFPLADVAVFPSQIPEAYPLVLMESLANGVLPIVADFSGFHDGLDELESFLGEDLVGLMRMPASMEERVPSLVASLNRLLREKDHDELKRRLRRLATENYDWSKRVQEFDAAYRRVLSRTEAGCRDIIRNTA